MSFELCSKCTDLSGGVFLGGVDQEERECLRENLNSMIQANM